MVFCAFVAEGQLLALEKCASNGLLRIRCRRPTTRAGEECIQWSFADPLPKANYSRWGRVHPMVFCELVAKGNYSQRQLLRIDVLLFRL